ncbi:unnamed protein product [Fraxinus pennsylvanica]|uniref:Uncharacterized protein n=1 Tax=Fraxinus pennsylvanica TaxID=56036 RepID=A0AAD1ZUJ3_9LAMI|nr:unnamed protein product [Fraxinus pennsylvanica]
MNAVERTGQKDSERDRVRVKRKTLEEVLQQCQMALQELTDDLDDDDDADDDLDGLPGFVDSSSSTCCDVDTAESCDLLQSVVEGTDFLEKLESAHASLPQNMAEEGSSWDMVCENDIWEDENLESYGEDFFFVRQEDIVEGIACFMAAYLLSLKQTKDVTPNQLQEALRKTFSLKKKKGKLQKALDGSRVIYNIASWGATAMGIYQNPVLSRAAGAAFWTSCCAISKLF